MDKSEDRVIHNPRMLRVEDLEDARRILTELGSEPPGVTIMSRKMEHMVIAVDNVQARAAHIIKQVMLSRGGECATPRDVFLKDREPVNVVMMGTFSQFDQAARNLSTQPFGLKKLAGELKELLKGVREGCGSFPEMQAGRYTLRPGERTLVMGVINVTPDSFSDGGVNYSHRGAVDRAARMVEAGADIVDVGGESTRPGARPVTPEEEKERTLGVVESIAGDLDVPVSIDTYKAEVARPALDAGASMVNDVSGLRFDPEMIPLVAERGCPVIIMHMLGEPRNMQENPTYTDVAGDIIRFLRSRAAEAVSGGVEPGKIMIDPGIGFGKTLEHNLEIMRRLEEFRCTGYPLVLGTSRKSFIGGVLGREVGERLLGTAATVAFAISRGVEVVRVHDVEEIVEVVRMSDALAGKSRPQGSGTGRPS